MISPQLRILLASFASRHHVVEFREFWMDSQGAVSVTGRACAHFYIDRGIHNIPVSFDAMTSSHNMRNVGEKALGLNILLYY